MSDEIVQSCFGCSFSQWDGLTQTGCSAGRLTKFAERGLTPIPAQNEIAEFFGLRYPCNMRWETNQPPKTVAQRRAEIHPKVLALVIIEPYHDAADINLTISSLAAQTLLPKQIKIVNKSEKSWRELLTINEVWCKDQIEARLFEPVDKEKGTLELVDQALAGTNEFTHFCVLEAGQEMDRYHLAKLDYLTNDECHRVGVYQKDEVPIINLVLHRHVGGNKEIDGVTDSISKIRLVEPGLVIE